MERRTLLRAVGVGIATATAGCMGGEVVHEVQRQVTIDPGGYWLARLPGVGGSGAMTYTVRADARFDVYVFTDREDFRAYESYHEDGSAERSPSGHAELSTTAVRNEERDTYEATSAADGSRASYDAEDESYFVVDHSSYGMGAEPAENAGPMRPFVDLQVFEESGLV